MFEKLYEEIQEDIKNGNVDKYLFEKVLDGKYIVLTDEYVVTLIIPEYIAPKKFRKAVDVDNVFMRTFYVCSDGKTYINNISTPDTKPVKATLVDKEELSVFGKCLMAEEENLVAIRYKETQKIHLCVLSATLGTVTIYRTVAVIEDRQAKMESKINLLQVLYPELPVIRIPNEGIAINPKVYIAEYVDDENGVRFYSREDFRYLYFNANKSSFENMSVNERHYILDKKCAELDWKEAIFVESEEL
jgi:hypothetical protein